MAVLVWQTADKCVGPWAEGWFKDSADGHQLVSFESCIWKNLSAAQEGVAGDVQGCLFAERIFCARHRSTWACSCSLDMLDQVFT